ncbi:MAG: hypothetical protein PHD13_03240 [Methanocellales archaeon]|nr:hypothetical protein [Methanocellales archaeon]MDD3291603.1 hypothetical protein [Methanocellales archaeon]MDD5235172.1 hypothetical protein [Methanocellales archaeon]MDD5485386.1 hypothetical protein [Methanocellales archaeon]
MKQKICLVFVLTVAFLALMSGAQAAHWISGTVNDAADSTPANGHTVIIYYLGDEANYVSDTIGPTGASGTNNMYMCDSESIPNHVWAPGDVIYAKVTDNGDGYTAGPVSVTTTGAGFDVMPAMTLQAAPDTTAPVITSPTATPSSIPADGATTSVLNATVTDNVGIASVTVDLSTIGGSATTAMTKVGTTDVYSVTTTASTSTALGTKSLTVTATDTNTTPNTATSSISLTVTAVPDTFAPIVTNPTATPSTIYANGIATSQLSVTVTDGTGIASVTVNLSAIGGSATTAMTKVGTTDVYSVTTTAAPTTAPGTYNLAVTATDSSTNANTNTSVSISLTVQALPVTITSVSIDDSTASKGQNFTARINMSSTVTGWYVVVVSGIESGGEGIAGIGTVYLTASQSVTNMPVLVHIPSQATVGSYTLYAGAYAIGDYPANLASIIDHAGPVTATVT